MDAERLVYYATFIPAIIAGITIHEFSHARVAVWFGDTTPAQQGRVTLNPLAHLDLWGSVLLIVIGFGWGKPVMVNRSAFRHRWADLLVSAAGPVSNLALAAAIALLIRMPLVQSLLLRSGLWDGASLLLPMVVYANVMLAVFNLLPFPPLDGSHVLEQLLPSPHAQKLAAFNATYGQALFLLLIASSYVTRVSVLSWLVGPPIDLLMSLLLPGVYS